MTNFKEQRDEKQRLAEALDAELREAERVEVKRAMEAYHETPWRDLKERIRLARFIAEISLADLARRVGVSRSAVSQWELGITSPSSERLRAVAVECGVSPDFLSTGLGYARSAMRGPRPIVHVTGSAEFGVWRQSQSEPETKEVSVLPADSRYPPEDQFDLRIRGNSVNRFARSGDLVRCVSAKAAPGPWPDGTYLAVERILLQNEAIERTILKLEESLTGRPRLIMDTDDPAFEKGKRATRYLDDNRLNILGIVLYAYRLGFIKEFVAPPEA